jgi:hypothetical protein
MALCQSSTPKNLISDIPCFLMFIPQESVLQANSLDSNTQRPLFQPYQVATHAKGGEEVWYQVAHLLPAAIGEGAGRISWANQARVRDLQYLGKLLLQMSKPVASCHVVDVHSILLRKARATHYNYVAINGTHLH